MLKRIKKLLKEIDTLDRVYYQGKLYSATIVLLSILAIGCLIIASILFKMEG